jgi:hypothetical protein
VKPNSLADLTLRENRFAHFAANPGASAFPYPLNTTLLSQQLTLRQRQIQQLTAKMVTLPDRTGEDVVASNALAFDVRVFDPAAPIVASANSGDALDPGDPGYWPVTGNFPSNPIGYGAFVDLGYGRRNKGVIADSWSKFSGRPNVKSQLIGRGTDGRWGRANVDDDNNGTVDDLSEAGWDGSDDEISYVYCTWATYYERNGVDEDNSGVADQGTNGFDDDNQNGVDDAGELETSPPYPTPLRGIQVRIRAWDPDSRHVRQATVATDFVPE